MKNTVITDRKTFNSLMLPLIALGTMAPASAARTLPAVVCPPPTERAGVTKEAFADYISAFNRKDFGEFGKYYVKDAVLELNASFHLNGRDAILTFYRQVQAHIHETTQVHRVIADAGGLRLLTNPIIFWWGLFFAVGLWDEE